MALVALAFVGAVFGALVGMIRASLVSLRARVTTLEREVAEMRGRLDAERQ